MFNTRTKLNLWFYIQIYKLEKHSKNTRGSRIWVNKGVMSILWLPPSVSYCNLLYYKHGLSVLDLLRRCVGDSAQHLDWTHQQPNPRRCGHDQTPEEPSQGDDPARSRWVKIAASRTVCVHMHKLGASATGPSFFFASFFSHVGFPAGSDYGSTTLSNV